MRPVVDLRQDSHDAQMNGDYWTYAEWQVHTIDKIVKIGLSAPEEDREDYLRCQIEEAVRQALRHGQAGLSENDPVCP